MANPTANTLVVLTLFASGHCFMSTLIDGPLKAAYSIFGNQAGRAAVASPTAYRQLSAQAPTVVAHQKQNGGLNHVVVQPNYNDKHMDGYNNIQPNVRPFKNEGWNGQSSSSQETDGSWNRKQRTNTDMVRDWVVDSDDVVLVKPASDFVIIAQPGNPTSSHGVVFGPGGGVFARNVFESL